MYNIKCAQRNCDTPICAISSNHSISTKFHLSFFLHHLLLDFDGFCTLYTVYYDVTSGLMSKFCSSLQNVSVYPGPLNTLCQTDVDTAVCQPNDATISFMNMEILIKKNLKNQNTCRTAMKMSEIDGNALQKIIPLQKRKQNSHKCPELVSFTQNFVSVS